MKTLKTTHQPQDVQFYHSGWWNSVFCAHGIKCGVCRLNRCFMTIECMICDLKHKGNFYVEYDMIQCLFIFNPSDAIKNQTFPFSLFFMKFVLLPSYTLHERFQQIHCMYFDMFIMVSMQKSLQWSHKEVNPQKHVFPQCRNMEKSNKIICQHSSN